MVTSNATPSSGLVNMGQNGVKWPRRVKEDHSWGGEDKKGGKTQPPFHGKGRLCVVSMYNYARRAPCGFDSIPKNS